jgi:hypothetical protein
VDGGSTIVAHEVSSMWNPRRHRILGSARSAWTRVDQGSLPATADATRGSSNLATQPRAGNISTDTRAGLLG